MHTECRRATAEDMDDILRVIAQGRAFFEQQGIPQWQNGYPSRETIAGDMQRGEAHVVLAEGRVAGTAALVFGHEPSYDDLQGGQWQSGENYAAVHRIGVDEAYKGSGLAGRFLAHLEGVAKAAGAEAVRVDTHLNNKAMRRFLQKNGYTERGRVYLTTHCLDDDIERVALEKLL